MERTKWTDKRLDERMRAIDKESSRTSTEVRELRREMRAGFKDLRGEIAGVRAELGAFHRQMIWLVGFLAVSLVSLLGFAVL
jgi:hypothetical protein